MRGWTTASPGLALERFRIGGFAGTSVADLAGVLGLSKAAIYYHSRSKNALLHRLVDPLLDAIDACIEAHSAPNGSAPAARQLPGDYLSADVWKFVGGHEAVG
jgi:AcrR family transcriptional regulator